MNWRVVLSSRFQSLLLKLRTPTTSFGGVLRLGGATAAGQMITILSTPILTRLYTPEDMGRFGLFQSYLILAVVGVCLRYDMGVVSAHNDGEASDLLTLSLVSAVPLALVAGAILCLLIALDSWSFGALSQWSVPAMVVACAGAGTFVAFRFWFIRQGDFAVVGRAMVHQGIARAALPILAGLGHLGWAGLVSGEIVGRVFGLRLLRNRAFSSASRYVPRFQAAPLLAVARRNWKYPAIVLPSSLVDALAGTITIPIVASLFGAPAAGEVFLAQRIVTLPAAFIAASVADVAHSKLAEEHRTASHQLTRSVFRIGAMLGAVALAIYIPVALVAPWGTALVLGEQWRSTGLIIALLTPLAVVSLIANPLSRLFVVVNRPELKLLYDAALVLAPIAAMIVTRINDLGVVGWSALFSLFSVVATLLGIGLAIYAAHHPALTRADD